MAGPGSLSLGTYVVGDTLQFGWTFRTRDGDPVDLRGTTAWMTVKADPADTDLLALLQIEHPLAEDDTDAEQGQFQMVAQASQTRLIPPGRHYFDLQIVWPASPEPMVQTYVLGRIKFELDVTRHTSTPEPVVVPVP